MPPIKKPTTFDAHLGLVIHGLAQPHGGRKRIAEEIGVSKKTVDRKITGDGFTVRELQLIAKLLLTSPEELVERALVNYGDGDRELGFTRLYNEGHPAAEDTSATDVGDLHEDDYEVTPGETQKADLALAANRRPKKVDMPYAE